MNKVILKKVFIKYNEKRSKIYYTLEYFGLCLYFKDNSKFITANWSLYSRLMRYGWIS